tara:strand:+ start:354 stop:497 length:144 start_codon:yes stop_codon:yes gene_type:complete
METININEKIRKIFKVLMIKNFFNEDLKKLRLLEAMGIRSIHPIIDQ